MSSGVLPASINNFRLTKGVKSARERAIFRSDPHHCGAGNTLAVLSRRNDAEAGGRASGFARFRRAAAQAILLRYCQGVARHKGVKGLVLGRDSRKYQ